MPITIKDIARKLKTSHVTVSKALRDQPRISDEMRAKIKRVALEMGYQPNFLGRGLQGGKTKTVGLLWSLSGPHASDAMANEIAIRIHNHHYVTYLANPLSLWDVTKKILTDFAQRQVDAIVLEANMTLLSDPEIIRQLSGFSAAVVVVPEVFSGLKDQIVLDRDSAIRQVVDHFIKTGRRKPGFLVPLKDSPKKIEAFSHRLRYHKIDVVSDLFIDVSMGENGSYRHIVQSYIKALEERFPVGRPPIDALLCSTDEGAAAAMAWLRTRGLRVPEDIAVVGFNDNDISQCFSPPLASVDRQETSLADAIERMLFTRLENPDLPPRREEIPMKFVWRESAG